ncbi:hypothetical protein BLOT_008158, partial [Blomia tropicalis]
SNNHIYTHSFRLLHLESSSKLVRFSYSGDGQCYMWRNNTFEFSFFIFVNLNAKLHCPVKRVIHLSFHDRKLANFPRMNIKIHNYIMAYNTNKKYGITYASFGLITMSSFVKLFCFCSLH